MLLVNLKHLLMNAAMFIICTVALLWCERGSNLAFIPRVKCKGSDVLQVSCTLNNKKMNSLNLRNIFPSGCWLGCDIKSLQEESWTFWMSYPLARHFTRSVYLPLTHVIHSQICWEQRGKRAKGTFRSVCG